jgi:hypothetical protein
MSRNSGMPHPVVGLLLLAFMVATHPVCLYAQDSGKTPPWYDAIAFHGFVSTAYSHNFNKPDSMINSYRVFDFDDNSMKVDVVEISLSTSQVAAGEAGFRLDVTAGSSIPKITRSAGLETGDLDVQTAYVIYNAPLGSGLRLDFGKFTTPMGYEVIEGYDGFNDNYSRSLLFGYAVPFTHTGLRTSYAFTSGLSATLMLVNGWDVAVDNNRSKSVGAQIGWLPVSGMNLLVNYMTGPEKSGNDQDSRRVLDIVGVYAIGEMATIGVNLDFGTEEHSAVDGSTAEWGGMALYARFNLHQDVSVSIRGEQFEDRDGIRTGVAQTLREVTLTPEYRPAEHFTLRGDIRVDHSDKTVFQKEGGWTDVQTTVSVNALYVF